MIAKLFLSSDTYKEKAEKPQRGCCMFFEAKVLKTMRIGEDEQRKKWLRGTG